MPLHRHVFFIAGFDPKSPRYYHRLFRALAAHRPAEAEGGARAVRVGPPQRVSDIAECWDFQWSPSDGGAELTSRLTFLRWDDVVRAHWARPARTVWNDLWAFYVRGARGPLLAAWRVSRLNALFLMFPLLTLLALAAVAAAGVAALWVWLQTALPRAAVPVALSAVAWAPAAVWWTWRRLSHATGGDWLLRLYGFSAEQAANRVPALEARADAMAALVADALEACAPGGEVLLVGHSTGATLAAAALARARGRTSPSVGEPRGSPAMLTLGHCTPLVYTFRSAHRARRELDHVSGDPAVTWVDYTAPADWAGCARFTPWVAAGNACLRRLSPRFPKLLTRAHYAALRRNRLAMHMQYLKPMDHAGRYDLLAMLAGPRTLRERHLPLRNDFA